MQQLFSEFILEWYVFSRLRLEQNAILFTQTKLTEPPAKTEALTSTVSLSNSTWLDSNLTGAIFSFEMALESVSTDKLVFRNLKLDNG